MTKEPEITTVSSGYGSSQTINQNFQNVQTKFQNTLSRDGSTPNSMEADLDMDNNDILNVKDISVTSLYIDGVPVAVLETDRIFSERNATNGARGKALGDGEVWSMDGLLYINETGGTALTDLSISDVAPFHEATPEHFGYTGSSIDADTTAVRAWAASGRKVLSLKPQTYTLNNRVFFSNAGDYVVNLNGATFDFTALGTDGGGLAVMAMSGSAGTELNITNISESYDAQGFYINTITTDVDHNYSAGDWVFLQSDDTIDPVGHDDTNEKTGQWALVTSVTADTFTINSRIYHSLTTTPKVHKPTVVDNVYFKGKLTLRGAGRDATEAGWGGLALTWVTNFTMDELVTESIDYQAFAPDNCRNVSLKGLYPTFDAKGSNENIQYGYSPKNACENCYVGRIVQHNGKHVVSHTRNSNYGIGKHNRIDLVVGYGVWNSVSAMHGNAVDCSVGRVEAYNSRFGVDIRASGWRFEEIYGEDVEKVVYLRDNPYGVSLGHIRGKRVFWGIHATDVDWIGVTEAGLITYDSIEMDDVSNNTVYYDFSTIPVYDETDSAVTAGTTTSITVADFPDARYNIAGARTGDEITIDPDGSGSAVEVVRIATHSRSGGENVFTWSSAIGTAPIAGLATYRLRSIVPDLNLGKTISRNCSSADVALYGNLVRVDVEEIIASADSFTDTAALLVQGTEDVFVEDLIIGNITSNNKAGLQVSSFTRDVKFKSALTFKTFGARGDGSTGANDMERESEAIQRGFDFVAQFGGKVHANANAQYTLNQPITGTGSVNVDWGNAKVHIADDIEAFTFSSTSTRHPLTTSYTLGSNNLSVADTGTPLEEGTIIFVRSDGIDPANRDSGSNVKQYRIGEQAVVGAGSTTSNIVLKAPLRYVKAVDPNDANLSVGSVDEGIVEAYTTTLSSEVVIVDDPDRTFEWTGGTFFYTEGKESIPWSGRLLNLTGYTQSPKIKNVTVTRGYSQGIVVRSTRNAVIENCYFGNLENNTSQGQYGYGVADNAFGTKVHNCHFFNTRHGYTTGNVSVRVASGETETDRIIGACMVESGIVSDCTATGHLNAPFDTHHGAYNITFADCIAYGGGNTEGEDVGFAIRGIGHVLLNPVVRGCEVGVMIFTEYSSGDTDDDFWTASKAHLSSVTVTNPDIEVDGLPFRVRSCFAYIGGQIRVKNTNQKLLDSTGVTYWNGVGRFEVTDYDGARDYVTDDSQGVFDIDEVHSLIPSGGQITQSRLIIADGASLDVDITNTTSATVPLFDVFTGSLAQVQGTVRAKLPSDGQVVVGNGDLEGEGEIVYELDGVADNSTTLNLEGKNINVRSVDKTVVWKAETLGLQDIAVYRDVTTITGAVGGVEIPNAYITPINDMVHHMARLGGGTVEIEFIFEHNGLTSAGEFKFDSYGSYQDAFTIASNFQNTFVKARIDVLNSTDMRTTFNWTTSERGSSTSEDTSTSHRTRTLDDTYSSSFIYDEAGNVLDFDPTFAEGDVVDLTYVSIRATAGGVL